MSEPEEIKIKSKKNHLWPVFLITAVLFLIFFSQYPNNLKTFFSADSAESQIKLPQEQPAIALEEIPEITTNPNPPEETQSTENSEQNAVSEEVTKEDPPKEDEEKEEVPRPDLVIGLIADAHTGQNNGFSHLSSALSSLKKYSAPDIIVDLGDLIESRNNGFISKKKAEADYKKAHAMIAASFSVYHVLGNHELLSMSKDNVSNLTGRKNYYAVTVKNDYRLIVLDANYTDQEEHIDAKHADDFIYTGTLSERQLEFLRNELRKNEKNLIFIHHPLWNLTNKNEVSSILKKYKDKIVMVANGHKHPLGIQPIDFGGVKNYNLPSAFHQKAYAVARINGLEAKVNNK